MTLQLQQQEMLSLMRSAASFDGGGFGKSHILSFASPTSQVSFLSTNKDGGGGDKASQSLPLSDYQHSTAPVYSRNVGIASGSMHGSFTGIRGPFTPAQWIELEHQALIYKYFTANVPVPATLLVPILLVPTLLIHMGGVLSISVTPAALIPNLGGVAERMERNGGAQEMLFQTKNIAKGT